MKFHFRWRSRFYKITWTEKELRMAWDRRAMVWQELVKVLPAQQCRSLPIRYRRFGSFILIEHRWIPGIDLRQAMGKNLGAGILEKFRAGVENLVRLEAAGFDCVHGDLSPANLLLCESGPVVWIDWDTLTCASSSARERRIFVKPAYLAPERARGGQASVASDVFALGAILYEVVSGSTLFATSSKGVSSAAEFSGQQLRIALQKAPASLRDFLARVLAPDPCSRVGSMRDFLEEFESALAQGKRCCAIAENRGRPQQNLSRL